MQSNIDTTKPTNTEPRIEDLRTNFAAAKTEIESAHARIDTLDSTTQTLTTASNEHGNAIAALDDRVSTLEQGGTGNGGAAVDPLDLWRPRGERWTHSSDVEISADTWTRIPYDAATWDTTAQPQSPDYLLPWQWNQDGFRAMAILTLQYRLTPTSAARSSQIRIGDDINGWTELEPADHPADSGHVVTRSLMLKTDTETGYAIEIKTSAAATLAAASDTLTARANAAHLQWLRATPAPAF